MEIGLGHLGYSPATFWALTLPEWTAAIEGYRERVGATSEDGSSEELNRDWLETLMEACPDG